MTQPPNPQPGWWQPPADGQPPQQPWPAGGGQQPQGPGGYPQHPGTGPQPAQPQQWPQQWPATPGGGQAYPGAAQPGTPYPAQQPGYDAQQQPSSYGGFGAFGGETGKPKKKSKAPIIGGVAAAVVLVGGAVAAWQFGLFQQDVLDQDSLQDGVISVLRDSYGEQDVANARCPDDASPTNGTTFDCQVEVAGQEKTVKIRVLNDKPEFEVGAPR